MSIVHHLWNKYLKRYYQIVTEKMDDAVYNHFEVGARLSKDFPQWFLKPADLVCTTPQFGYIEMQEYSKEIQDYLNDTESLPTNGCYQLQNLEDSDFPDMD